MPAYLTDNNTDDLARMVAALLTEVWIMRDRMAVTERILADRLGVTSAEIDDFIPDAAMVVDLERLRDRLIGAVVTAPVAPRDATVEASLRRAGMDEAAARIEKRRKPGPPPRASEV